VGSFAVQLAKAFGAEVTGVAGTASLELVRSIGADDVIDYTREDVTDGTRHWDVILDTAGPPDAVAAAAGPDSPRGRWSSSAAKGRDGGWAASTATSGRCCCHGS
jgi:NADPH:quinone reductase-like Zn-dependent oxidoreductase